MGARVQCETERIANLRLEEMGNERKRGGQLRLQSIPLRFWLFLRLSGFLSLAITELKSSKALARENYYSNGATKFPLLVGF